MLSITFMILFLKSIFGNKLNVYLLTIGYLVTSIVTNSQGVNKNVYKNIFFHLSNFNLLQNGEKIRSVPPGGSTALDMPGILREQSGLYQCMAVNGAGADSVQTLLVIKRWFGLFLYCFGCNLCFGDVLFLTFCKSLYLIPPLSALCTVIFLFLRK